MQTAAGGPSIDDVAEFHIFEIVDGLAILSITGAADFWAAPALRDELQRAERSSPRGLIVCLDGATCFGAAAFAVLNAVAQRVAATGTRPVVAVCAPGHIASRVLRLLHFKGRQVDTLAAALLLVRCAPSEEPKTPGAQTQPRASAS